MTHRSTWKQAERRVAAFWKSKRTPLSGGNSGHSRSDTLSKHFFVETKLRAANATFKLFRETKELAKKEKKIPVVCLCQKYDHGFLVVTDAASFPALARKFLVVSAFEKLKGKEHATN